MSDQKSHPKQQSRQEFSRAWADLAASESPATASSSEGGSKAGGRVQGAHTPTPWRWTPSERDGDDIVGGAMLWRTDVPRRSVFSIDCGDYLGLSDADAEFIVTACNAHHDLVSALKRAKVFIEYARYELEPGLAMLGSQFPHQEDADKVIAQLADALTKAERT